MTVLEELYAAFARDNGDALLAARPQLATSANADDARAHAEAAVGHGDPQTATLWALVAENLYHLIGNTEASLSATLLRFSVLYAAAQNPQQYGRVRDALLNLADVTERAGYPTLSAEARVTAADCSYWALNALPSPDPEKDRLAHQLLKDVATAWTGGDVLESMQLERLGSLSVECLNVWLERVELLYDEEPRDLAGRIVLATHAYLPLDVFDRPDGAEGRSVIAARLARAAVRLGLDLTKDTENPDGTLVDRLRVALDLAEQDGQDDAWAIVCQAILQDVGDAFDPGKLTALRGRFYRSQDHRGRFRSRLGRLAGAASFDELVGADLSNLVDAEVPDVEQIFNLAETAAARTLLDGLHGLLTTPDDELCRTLERAATDFEQPEHDDLLRREMRLLSELPVASTDVLAQLEDRYAQLDAGFIGTAETAALNDVQALLSPGELMVRYVLPYRWSHPAYRPGVVVATREDAVFVRLPELGSGDVTGKFVIGGRSPLDVSPFVDALFDARGAVSGVSGRGAEAHELLTVLDDLLLAPVRATGLAEGCDRWVLVPQRSLHLVPWMALVDRNGHWLLDEAKVTVAPSASVWATLRQRARRSTGRLGFLADPLVGYAGLPQLPGAMSEMSAVALAWRSRGLHVEEFPQEDATYKALANAGAASDVLVIAAHGSFPGDAALFDHQLLLSPNLEHPGPVTADALRRLDLSGVSCVVLSVCDGGAYRVGRGDEPYGLVPALLEAGARSVIAAQWAVDDERTRALMTRTVELLAQVDPAEALQRACREHRKTLSSEEWTHAAFLSVGG
ncbi:CHAT domain-containing protein [Nocardioides iriomotensis]|uniref:CHAT domain-containing protein n=1 Tax=Nocardioides iriomotensis TaxID=715784 RepID=A0A4Q5J7Z8_9ACTN|nr:CHAT domain-containing protein [Nocardioides iriomotensis]RYU14830.1 CHAT domain-containing protein [Nocardioides iriomotensis]